MVTQFYKEQILLPPVEKYHCLHHLSQDIESIKNALRDRQALNLTKHKLQMCRVFWLYLFLFLIFFSKTLVDSHPKKSHCNNIIISSVALEVADLTSLRLQLPQAVSQRSIWPWHAGDPQRPQTSISAHHATLLLFPGMLHFMAAYHMQVVGGKAMFTVRFCLFLQGCFDAIISAISPSTGPLSTDDQSSKTLERF